MKEARKKEFSPTYITGLTKDGQWVNNFSLPSEEKRISYVEYVNKARKELESATTLEEVEKVERHIPTSVQIRRDAYVGFENILLAKKADFAMTEGKQKLESATTVEEVRNVFHSFGFVNEIKLAALAKWNDLSLKELEAAITLEEVIEVFKNSPHGSEVERAALAKWNDLSLKELEATTTLEEVIAAYYYSPYCSEAERVAQDKAYVLAAKRQ